MIVAPVQILIAIIFGYKTLKTNDPFDPARFLDILIYAIIMITFWVKSGQTPGKKATDTIILDRITLKKPSLKQSIIRFFGYFLSIITLGLGFVMIAIRKDKRALHDIISNTIVIYK
jgi:uncharacterized RDD family membrane protein YckC